MTSILLLNRREHNSGSAGAKRVLVLATEANGQYQTMCLIIKSLRESDPVARGQSYQVENTPSPSPTHFPIFTPSRSFFRL